MENTRSKKKNKGNVFKVAGAKSLKKIKSKAVNLGLKNIKKRVEDIDAEFVEISKKPKNTQPISPKQKPKPAKEAPKCIPTKEEVARTAEKMVKMDL